MDDKLLEDILIDMDDKITWLSECNDNNRKLLLAFAVEIKNLSGFIKEMVMMLDESGSVVKDIFPESSFEIDTGMSKIDEVMNYLNNNQDELEELEKELEEYKEQLSLDGQLGIS
tara:strand:- start:277 stop:621 length:345 start_codon:yes stop_codon:yes gene_type:complete